MNRKQFLHRSAILGCGMSIPAITRAGQAEEGPYKPEIVKEFVSAGHNNLERVKQMLEDHPNLVFARWDLGQGDFEEAIEGAAHVGNKEIAKYLIEKGARPNLFVLTTLGETALVKPVIEKFPSLLHGKGAHGFTLLHHAARGGDESAELLEYFKSKGLTEMRYKIK